MAERISVSVTPNSLLVASGETTQATVALKNTGQTVDQFTVSVDGLQPGWYSLPVSSVALFPNDQDTLKVIINAPKAEAKGGVYPFHIKVTSQENPSDSATLNVSLSVTALPEVALEIQPPVLTGNKGHYRVVVTNPGTSEAALELKAISRDARLKFTQSAKTLNIPAGGRQETDYDASLSWLTYFFGKEAAFQVAAAMPGGTEAKTVDGRLVPVRWYRAIQALLPWLNRPPQIVAFKATTDDNRQFKVSWSVKRATTLKLDDETVPRQGERSVRPSEARSYRLSASNSHGDATKALEIKPVTVPPARACDRIKVALSQSQVKVSAGGSPVPVSVQVQNTGQIVDKFTVDVEGIDQGWFNRSASSVALMPQATSQAQMLFQPPKQKPVREGTYPFAVTIRSQATPDDATIVLGQLDVLPLVDFKAAVLPYRLTSRGKGRFRVSLTNTGVSEAKIELEANDLDEGLNFRFKNEAPSLPAWSTVEIPMAAKPKRNSVIGERKRYDITVNARAGSAKTEAAKCEMTHTPLMASWRPIVRAIRIIIALAILIVVVVFVVKWGGGWSTLTKSPQTWVDQFVKTIEGWFSR